MAIHSTVDSQLYAYDGLSRLTDLARGYFPTADRQKITGLTLAETWQLDATGNWGRYGQTNGVSGGQDLAQTRVSNRANEIVDVAETYGDAWATPQYDRAGNMTTIPLPASTNPINPYPAVYDAWNRLVSVPAYSQSYRYDGLHRRITSGTGASQRHYYYSASWQVLEERIGTNPDTAPPERQFVWGLRYLDDCVLRDRSPTNNGVLSERLYALQDANWNVTCLVDPAGAPVERYTYRAYGAPWFYSGTFVPRAFGGLYQWETLYAGYRFDLFTGLYQVRYRYLHPGLGCWLTRDPLEYIWRTPNLAFYVEGNPVRFVDPTGLQPPHLGGGTGVAYAPPSPAGQGPIPSAPDAPTAAPNWLPSLVPLVARPLPTPIPASPPTSPAPIPIPAKPPLPIAGILGGAVIVLLSPKELGRGAEFQGWDRLRERDYSYGLMCCVFKRAQPCSTIQIETVCELDRRLWPVLDCCEGLTTASGFYYHSHYFGPCQDFESN